MPYGDLSEGDLNSKSKQDSFLWKFRWLTIFDKVTLSASYLQHKCTV